VLLILAISVPASGSKIAASCADHLQTSRSVILPSPAPPAPPAPPAANRARGWTSIIAPPFHRSRITDAGGGAASGAAAGARPNGGCAGARCGRINPP
jgi:hypothetical protein